MAEMSVSDDHHWNHLQAKTDLAAEKILTESVVSGNMDNAISTSDKEPEPDSEHLAPSISGAIETFMSKNSGKELSDKQVMYKLHKAVSDQVSDDLMFPSAQDITAAVPESVIPDQVLEKHIPEEQDENQ